MNRRDLLKSLTALPALAPLIELEESPTKPKNEMFFGEWQIRWYGWTKLPNQHVLIGYWYAVNINVSKKLMAYSACPGSVGWIFEGQLIDTTVYEDQIFITPDTPIHIAEKQQKKALDKLIRFLSI